MKKLIISAVIILMTMTSLSQTSEHITFKGIPINGTLNEFVSKLKQSGFIHIETSDGTAFLKGNFAGYSDCEVYVFSANNKDLVDVVKVLFPICKDWNCTYNYYAELKSLLTEKYGNRSKGAETFNTMFQPTSNSERENELAFGNCVYYSDWYTKVGNIELFMSNENAFNYRAVLIYTDKINSAIQNQNAIDDL